MSELKVTGEIIQILPMQTGASNAGKAWQKLDFVIQTQEQFPKTIAFTLFGDKTRLIDGVGVGQVVDVSFNVESREFNGKYFHNVNAWKVTTQAQAPHGYTPPTQNEAPPVVNDAESTSDELPF